MDSIIKPQDIELFRSIFSGREDIFALRWEKGGKSGYMPAYQFDPYHYKMHKISGGNFQNYSNKQYKPLTDEEIIKHLQGEQFIGIYPLLKDNTSWFIVADFDGENWQEESLLFIKNCSLKNIPAYLERSRSGMGGHVWIFFEEVYPAYRSRKIIISLLEESGIFSVFDKHTSFDRLFPNQDYLSGKGFGNLIALPLNRTLIKFGNNCFVNPENLEPYNNQFEFIKTIQRISANNLNSLFENLNDYSPPPIKSIENKVSIRLKNNLLIHRYLLPMPLVNFIREELNFANNEYYVKKNAGKNVWNTQRYFKLIEETTDNIVVPRGFTGKLIRFCKEKGIEYNFTDERPKINPTSFSPEIELREYQKPVLEAVAKKDLGVIVAPPGSGKTIIALSIIAAKRLPALVIVHRKQLADQWMDRIEAFLGIPRKEIGKIGQGKNSVGKQITVDTIQSLTKLFKSNEGIKELSTGTIIVDECHHLPAETYKETIAKIQCVYLYGLTATPFRKYNDGKLIFTYLGDIVAEVKMQEIKTAPWAKIIVRKTDLHFPFNIKTDKFETLSKVLVHDSARNKRILDDIIAELSVQKRVVVITERKEHIDTLNQYLKQKYEVLTLSGEDSGSAKSDKWKIVKEGNYQVLITTGQYFGEGSDIHGIDTLFLVYPFAFEGKMVQYIGRVQRAEVTPTVYDYRDYQIEYLEKLFQKRNAFYSKLYLHGTLFDQPENGAGKENTSFLYEERILVPFEQLEFQFGKISFKHLIPVNNIEVQFEIENTEVRSEFNVLKAYFKKILKTKKAKIDISVRFNNTFPESVTASSYDLNKINREIIDSVKFTFVNREIIKGTAINKGNILDLNEVQNQEQNQPLIYQSEKDLLNDILKNKNVKHYRQLVYLSQKHESTVLKLRFVLSPFSFVFLIAGYRQYHIVWETLDSEEATYIWHLEKNIQALKRKLLQIDRDIGHIRTQGRHSYIEGLPESFTRIIHDYTNNLKGFVIWKDLLEEKLV